MTRQSTGLDSPAPKLDMSDSTKTIAPIAKAAEAPLKEPRVWNTKNLGLRLATDFFSGVGAASMVAPLITVIDKWVFSPATTMTILTCLQSHNAECFGASLSQKLLERLLQDLPSPTA